MKRSFALFFLCWLCACMAQDEGNVFDKFDIEIGGLQGKKAWKYIKKFMITFRWPVNNIYRIFKICTRNW